jgi:hypothetical protein
MPTWDIRWQQINDLYFSDQFDCSGNKVRGAEVQKGAFPDGDPASSFHYAENIHSWVFIQTGTSKSSCGPTFIPGTPSKLPMGISAFNNSEKDPDGYNGLRNKGIGGYQGFGKGATGPTFTNGSVVFFSTVRNFQIRRHGTEQWQAGNPGPGQDGDTL